MAALCVLHARQWNKDACFLCVQLFCRCGPENYLFATVNRNEVQMWTVRRRHGIDRRAARTHTHTHSLIISLFLFNFVFLHKLLSRYWHASHRWCRKCKSKSTPNSTSIGVSIVMRPVEEKKKIVGRSRGEGWLIHTRTHQTSDD